VTVGGPPRNSVDHKIKYGRRLHRTDRIALIALIALPLIPSATTMVAGLRTRFDNDFRPNISLYKLRGLFRFTSNEGFQS
jgi:hypothetical protein